MTKKTPHTNTENTTENSPENSLENSGGHTDMGDKFNKEALPEKIGMNLRQIYDDVLAEPVPDDFLNLLAKADKK